MNNELAAPQNQTGLALIPEGLADQTRAFIENAKSSATRTAYAKDWRRFSDWCEEHGLCALPAEAETVCLYCTDCTTTCRPATITRSLASISVAHQAARHESPTRTVAVRLTMQGIRRTKGTAQREVQPVTMAVLRSMVNRVPEGLLGVRDRALLLVGFAGAFRRSELVGLNREDVTFNEHGIEILLRRSKTDQDGTGTKIAIPYGSKLGTCPVRSLQAWIDAAGISEGALFLGVNRHGQAKGRLTSCSIALIVKKYAEACGLDSAEFSGHSLRAGLVTAAAAAGVAERVIQKQSRHKSILMLRKYIREGDMWRENAAAEVGL